MFLLPYLPINDWLMTNHHNFPPNYWFRSIFFPNFTPLPPPLSINHQLAADAMTLKKRKYKSKTSFDWSDPRLWLICEILIDNCCAHRPIAFWARESIIKCWIRRWLFGDRALLIMLPVGKSGRGWAEDYRWGGGMIRSINWKVLLLTFISCRQSWYKLKDRWWLIALSWEHVWADLWWETAHK